MGHFKIAKWLLTLGADFKCRDEVNCAFEHSCLRGHLKITQWLYMAIITTTKTFVSCRGRLFKKYLTSYTV